MSKKRLPKVGGGEGDVSNRILAHDACLQIAGHCTIVKDSLRYLEISPEWTRLQTSSVSLFILCPQDDWTSPAEGSVKNIAR